MKKTEVKFEITATPILIQKIGQLMAKCDLGVDSLYCPDTCLVSWHTTSKVDKAYITKMKEALKAYYDSEGCVVDHIIYIKP